MPPITNKEAAWLCGAFLLIGLYLGTFLGEWHVVSKIKQIGVFESGNQRIVGKVEEKQWPKE